MVSKTPQIITAALAGVFLSACHDPTAVTRSADNLP